MNRTILALTLSMVFSSYSSSSFAQEAIATAVAAPAASVPKVGPITVTVELLGGQSISGTLTDATQLPVKTSFGEASVPWAEVAGVRLASAEDSSTTIIMKNGDSITGATDLKVLTVDTEWGSAKINGSSVKSILLLPDLKWNATIGLSGKRWNLVDARATNPSAGPGSNVPGSSSRSSTSSNSGLPSGSLPSGSRLLPN